MKITIGSKNKNTENPNKAPPREIAANHLLIFGTFDIGIFLFVRKHFDTMSREKPTGHKYLQNQRVLNHVNNRTTNPIRLDITKNFTTKTELSIKKGLNQFDIPVS